MYQVTVLDENGATVFEVTGPAEVIRQFVPAAVGSVLGAESVQVGRPESADGQSEPTASGEQKQRRPRRTKAEMQAERAAEALAAGERAVIDGPGTGEPAPEASAYNPFG